jgi:hypothetical protein
MMVRRNNHHCLEMAITINPFSQNTSNKLEKTSSDAPKCPLSSSIC